MVPNWYLILFLELYQISKTLIFPNKNESDISYRSLQGVLVEYTLTLYDRKCVQLCMTFTIIRTNHNMDFVKSQFILFIFFMVYTLTMINCIYKPYF